MAELMPQPNVNEALPSKVEPNEASARSAILRAPGGARSNIEMAIARRPLRTPGIGRAALYSQRSNQTAKLASGLCPSDAPESPHYFQDSTSSRLKISVWSLYEKISP